MKLTFAAVQVGNYAGRGQEYAAKLFAGVRANMPSWVKLRCVCLTDDPATLPKDVEALPVLPGISGWWNKLLLFRPGTFKRGERILYSDLDTIFIGDLRDFNHYSGKFAAMRDPLGYCRIASSVMAWEAGTLDHIWTKWDEAGRPQFDPHGDQAWIGAMMPDCDYLQDMLPRQIVSFKKDCWLQGRIPADASILMFHGAPRPHQCRAPYIMELWNRDVITGYSNNAQRERNVWEQQADLNVSVS